jgi:D-Tyr-tRNAtyr deacylase
MNLSVKDISEIIVVSQFTSSLNKKGNRPSYNKASNEGAVFQRARKRTKTPLTALSL